MKNTNANIFIEEINEATKFGKKPIFAMFTTLIVREQIKKFNEGYQMMLWTDDLVLKPGIVKTISPKHIGPFPFFKKHASGLAYQLKMTLELGEIHDTFHICMY